MAPEELPQALRRTQRELADVLPRARPYYSLERAYVEARYNRGYKITKTQLDYLAERVRKLQRLTKQICEARIESYLPTR